MRANFRLSMPDSDTWCKFEDVFKINGKFVLDLEDEEPVGTVVGASWDKSEGAFEVEVDFFDDLPDDIEQKIRQNFDS